MLHKTLSLSEVEIKLSGAKTGEFTGYASVFGGVDSYGDTIAPGAYKDTLEKNPNVRMFFNHQHDGVPLGSWKLEEDSKGLLGHGKLTMGISLVKDIYAAMEAETIDGLSIGYKLRPGDYEEKEDGRLIKRVSYLGEVSIVSFPADDAARISDVKSSIEQIETVTDFERWLRDVANLTKGQAVSAVARARAALLRDSVEAEEAKELRELADRMIKLRSRFG